MADQTLLLHVGLPKTGTTSLQKWCDTNREALSLCGVDYPPADPDESARKHQFVVRELMSGTLRCTESLLQAADPAKKLLLSTEGLTNHLYDFPEASLTRFRELVAAWDVRILLVVRDEESWTKSYHKQLVLNPPHGDFGYATSLPLSEFSWLPRVRRLLDHASLSRDLRTHLGARSVTVQRFEDDWFDGFRAWVGLDPGRAWPAPGHEHASCSDDVVEIVRLINRMQLPPDERAHCLHALATGLECSGKACEANLGQIAVFYSPLGDVSRGNAIWATVMTELARVTPAGSTVGRLVQSIAPPELREGSASA